MTVNNKDVLKADYIICNSDPPNVYKNLIKPNNYGFLFNKKIERMNYSMGLFVIILDQKNNTMMLRTIRYALVKVIKTI